MMLRLIRNTMISGSSLLATSLMLLLPPPMIIHHWGLTEFGIIALSRTFLLGFSGSLDLGVGEIATMAVARARQNGNWQAASNQISLALKVTCVMGFAIALILIGLSFEPSWFLKGDHAYASDLSTIMIVSALANIAVFPTLVADGTLRGFERFGTLRAIELFQTLLYVLGVIAAVFADTSHLVIIYVSIAATILTNGLKAFAACRLGIANGITLRNDRSSDAVAEFRARAWLLTQSKLLGAVQGPLLPVIISWLFGPRSVGIYDLLLRLPRAAKTILSLLNGALLPVSTRIDEADDGTRRRRLGHIGMVLLPAITVPPLVICASLSKPILNVWIGPQLLDYWPWMAAMFMIPICAQYISFGGVMVLSQTVAMRKLNRIALVQIAVIVCSVIAMASTLQERSFVFGQALGWALSLPLQITVIAAAVNLSLAAIGRVMFAQLALLLLAFAVGVSFSSSAILNSSWALIMIIALACTIIWVAEYFIVLRAIDRLEIHEIVAALYRHPKSKGVAKPK